MLSLVFIHIIISGACLSAGFLFYQYLPGNRLENNGNRPILFYLISGLISLTVLSQILALFIPLNTYSQGAVFIILSSVLLAKRKPFLSFLRQLLSITARQSLLFYIAAGAIWLLLLLLNAGKTMMDDTESYHIQMVKWLKEFGTVPGLVHLHERFGFNSSWFSSIALFSPQSGTLNYYTGLNGVLSLWFSWYLVGLAADPKKNGTVLSATAVGVLGICIVLWPLLRGNVSTSNYDYITLLVTFALFTETFKSSSDSKTFPFAAEWIIWPVYLFTVRITNYPFLILGIIQLIYLLKQRDWYKILACTGVCLLLVLPFLARNIMLSGYLFYPAMYFDWFTVDWKADKHTTTELLHFIKYFNRVSTGHLPLETTAAMDFSHWPKAWMSHMLSYDRPVVIAGLAGLLPGVFLVRWIKTGQALMTRVFIFTMLANIVSWFFIAPDPRFIYGCLLCGIFLVFSALFTLIKKRIKTAWLTLSLLLVTIVITGFTAQKVIKEPGPPNLSMPARLPQPPVKTVFIGYIPVYIPEKILNNWNPRCYATKLPCAYNVDPRVRPRGSGIKDGFRIDN